jgi:uncharacterized membrane protein
MFSAASAYAVYTIRRCQLPRLAFPVRVAFGIMLATILAMGMLYPVLGIHNRMFIETGRASGINNTPLTLDGGQGFMYNDDYNAILCLKDIVGSDEAVVAEANPEAAPPEWEIPVNYNPSHGRVGSLTGIPVIGGWPGHDPMAGTG